MNGRAPIVFVDSGKGGIPYLLAYHAHAPTRSLIYIADTAAFPYGMKGRSELCRILLQTITRVIQRFHPALIVLACNTASVTALQWLRQSVSTPLVGVVPAVKPASAHTTVGRIGLLVTERTAAGDYLQDLIGEFAADQVVVTVAASDVVSYVERSAVSLAVEPAPTINELIDQALAEFAAHTVDTLVLGCTHFVYIAHLLERKVAGRMSIIDSRTGVVKRILSLVNETQPVGRQRQCATCYSTSATLSSSFHRLLDHCHITHGGVL